MSLPTLLPTRNCRYLQGGESRSKGAVKLSTNAFLNEQTMKSITCYADMYIKPVKMSYWKSVRVNFEKAIKPELVLIW